MTGPFAEKVRASIKAHDPQGTRTIAEAEAEVATVERQLEQEGAA